MGEAYAEAIRYSGQLGGVLCHVDLLSAGVSPDNIAITSVALTTPRDA